MEEASGTRKVDAQDVILLEHEHTELNQVNGGFHSRMRATVQSIVF